ncbi:MAG: hypothetical protein ABJZ55_20550 [Fuerstiella sp.]
MTKPIKFCRRKRRGSRSENIGRVRWKLFEMLGEAGFDIATPEQLWMQEGFYRRHGHDLARWGVDFTGVSSVGGQLYKGHHTLFSWDTMTSCCRYGFTAIKQDMLRWEISSNET